MEKYLIRHCAPTLASLKPANLVPLFRKRRGIAGKGASLGRKSSSPKASPSCFAGNSGWRTALPIPAVAARSVPHAAGGRCLFDGAGIPGGVVGGKARTSGGADARRRRLSA